MQGSTNILPRNESMVIADSVQIEQISETQRLVLIKLETSVRAYL